MGLSCQGIKGITTIRVLENFCSMTSILLLNFSES